MIPQVQRLRILMVEYNGLMATIGSETQVKPRLVPMPNGGKLWCGPCENPVAGPGKPSKAEQTAKERIAEATEKQIHAQAEKIVSDAIAAWERGQQGPLTHLLDRHWGPVIQKTEVVIKLPVEFLQITIGIVASWLREVHPELAESGLATLQERLFDPQVVNMVQGPDGGYSAPVESEPCTQEQP